MANWFGPQKSSADPEFESCSDNQLGLFQLVLSLTTRLQLFIAKWFVLPIGITLSDEFI